MMSVRCKRPGVILTDSGVMLIDLPDTPVKATPASKQGRWKRPHVETVGQAAAKRPRLVIRAPTPLSQVVQSVISRGPKPWKTTALKEPDPIYKHFKETGCGIRSKKTWLTYVRNITTVRKMCGGVTVLTLLQHPEATIKTVAVAVKSTKLSPHTHSSLLNALLATIRHALSCKSKASLKQTVAVLQKAHHDAHLLAEQGAITNTATERQQAGFMSYSQLCKVRDGLPLGSRERLLMASITFLPPPRNDLACCKLFSAPPGEEQLAQYLGNYMVLQPDPASSYVVYRMFKTRRWMGEVRVALPPALVQEILLSLKQQPRQWLFTLAKDVEKPYSNSSFSRWANFVLQKVCQNRFITLSLVRHSYSSWAQECYDISKCTDEGQKALCRQRLQAIARAMLHSTKQMLRYRFTMLEQGPAPVDNSTIHRPQAASKTPIVVQALPPCV
jgi:hypothetical protein